MAYRRGRSFRRFGSRRRFSRGRRLRVRRVQRIGYRF